MPEETIVGSFQMIYRLMTRYNIIGMAYFPYHWDLVRRKLRSPVVYHGNGQELQTFAWADCWTSSRVVVDLRHNDVHVR